MKDIFRGVKNVKADETVLVSFVGERIFTARVTLVPAEHLIVCCAKQIDVCGYGVDIAPCITIGLIKISSARYKTISKSIIIL